MLDGVEAVKICVGYKLEGTFSEILPVGAEELERCHPVYEELPGWMESTVGIKAYDALPRGARDYLSRIEEPGRRADRPHLDRPRPRRDDRHAPPLRR